VLQPSSTKSTTDIERAFIEDYPNSGYDDLQPTAGNSSKMAIVAAVVVAIVAVGVFVWKQGESAPEAPQPSSVDYQPVAAADEPKLIASEPAGSAGAAPVLSPGQKHYDAANAHLKAQRNQLALKELVESYEQFLRLAPRHPDVAQVQAIVAKYKKK
jgi:hypothetical protein